jgi:adenylosuccinate synthase
MSNVVVVGAQWGDEGKGKVVDLLPQGRIWWFFSRVETCRAHPGVNGVKTICH